jgi:hypothetical protein
LALAPALACPGATDALAFPDAEPPAVCAAEARLNRAAVIVKVKKVFIFSLTRVFKLGKSAVCWIQNIKTGQMWKKQSPKISVLLPKG